MKRRKHFVSRSRRGAVLLIVLLGMTLLVGIVFFVYNLGDQVNRRMDMQNTADSVSVSGAVWMSRSMNMLAMNNVGQVKLMSLSPVLDALPLAAEVALDEIEAEQGDGPAECLEYSLGKGIPNTGQEVFPMTLTIRDMTLEPDDPGYERTVTTNWNFLRKGLERLLVQWKLDDGDDPTESDTQRKRLQDLDNALNSSDEREPEAGAYAIGETTHWQWDGEHGRLWAAALTLDELSQATAEAAGVLAQTNAVVFGESNQSDASFLVPLQPKIEHRRGTIRDFDAPLVGKFVVTNDEAHLSMPINDEVERINKLDLSLDDIEGVHPEDNKTYKDGTPRPISEGLLDYLDENLGDLEEGDLSNILTRANKMEAKRSAIASRLRKSLSSIRNQITRIKQLLGQAQAENDPVKKEDLIAQLIEAHETLSDAALDEMESEELEKEDRFLQLHRVCPGGGIPDFAFPHRLGPYARLMKWRRHIYKQGTGSWTGGGGSDSEFGQDHIRTQSPEKIGYYTYGPYYWAMLQMDRRFGNVGWRTGTTSATRFSYYHQWISNIKLAYAFGVSFTQKIKFPTEWIKDFDKAKEFAEDRDNRRKIIRTRWYRVRVMSSVSSDDPQWLVDPATFWSRERIYWASSHDLPEGVTLGPNERVVYPFFRRGRRHHRRHWYYSMTTRPPSRWIYERRGWYDIEPYLDRQTNGTVERLPSTNSVCWRWTRQDKVFFDQRIGLGTPGVKDVLYDRYMCSWYVFGGLQIGEEVSVANPLNWPDGESEELPAPILMDIAAGDYDSETPDHDEGVRRTHFSFLGVAWEPNPSPVWAERFVSAGAFSGVTTVAQSEVFNTSSWGYWTQDWRTQLVPVSKWSLPGETNPDSDLPEGWTERMDHGLGDIDETGGELDEEKVREVVEYLRSLSPDFAEMFLTH